jgi:large-conductance mechanosensitive channel
MDQPTTTPRKTSAFNTMRAKGLGLCGLGFAMLSLPLFASESPMLAAYASALRPAGWFALAAGIVLLGIHHVRNAKRSKAKASPLQQPTPDAPAPTGQPTLRDIRAEIQKRQAEKH